MNISVILATYKRPEILRCTLESFSLLVKGELKWDLWVVDNAGDASTELVVKGLSDKLPINYLVEKKPGKNNALNYAIPHVKGELIVFTDDDVLADKYWLVEMLEGAKRWGKDCVFGGCVLPHWPAGFDLWALDNPYLRSAFSIADWKISEGVYQSKNVFGSNMAVRKEIFDKDWRFNSDIGPTNKNNYVMGSETEFVLRLADHGYQAIYLPKSVVYHQIRQEQLTIKWLKERAFRAGKGIANSDKCISEKCFIGIPRYLIRRLIETYLCLAFPIAFKKKSRLESLMAHWSVRGMICQYLKNRKRRI